VLGLYGAYFARASDADRAVRLFAASGVTQGIAPHSNWLEPSAMYDRYLAEAHAGISAERFAALWQQGARLPLRDAVALAAVADRTGDRAASAAAPRAPAPPAGLTAREIEVLRLVAAGMTDRQIAAALVLSEGTVGRHLANIYGKLRVSSRAAATVAALRAGIA
jgi:DNA-binding NarL/FixJ family response regulator